MEEDPLLSDIDINTIDYTTSKLKSSTSCPYLSTINRNLLDFDYEKICSVTNININIYCCLICGKYYNGRYKTSSVYIHSISYDHHVFINLETTKIYCLPENYEIIDNSLDDIKYNIKPIYNKHQIQLLDKEVKFSKTLDNNTYIPGYIGFNNIGNNDWLNSILQCLIHIPMLRDYFLLFDELKCKSDLVNKFSSFIKNCYNSNNYKSHISPFDICSSISIASNKKYICEKKSDPYLFLSWFLNKLHLDLGGTKKKNSSIIYKVFQGELTIRTEGKKSIEVEITQPIKPVEQDLTVVNLATLEDISLGKRKRDDANLWDDNIEPVMPTIAENAVIKRSVIKDVVEEVKLPFLFLSLNLPQIPLFRDAIEGGSVIHQVSLFELLQKFDGKTPEILLDGTKKYYSISHMPNYLILHFKRFVINNFFLEKNNSIVNFPIKGMPLADFQLREESPSIETLKDLPISKLRDLLKARNLKTDDILSKADMINTLILSYKSDPKYDLLGNITHAGKPDEGSFKSHIYCKPKDQWFEMEDLHVTETMPQLVSVSESYMQFYELQK